MNKSVLNFEYSFKCEDEIRHFKNLSDHEQCIVESIIVQVIYESFLEPADEDYIAARLLAQKGMGRAYFWAASQSLEKYLKAFLLLRGVSVIQKHFEGHPIHELYNEACTVDPELTAIDTKRHSDIKIDSNFASIAKEISVIDFIKDIGAQGSPHNRYNSFGVSFDTSSLFALDSFVFGLRQKIGVPPIQVSLRKVDSIFLDSFYLYNPWFTQYHVELEELPNVNFNLRSSVSLTTLDRLISKHAPVGSGEALQWLEKKIKLPKKVKEYLK